MRAIATLDRSSRILSLGLSAGLGLLAVGGASLWSALRDADTRAMDDARRSATAVATELRRAMTDGTALALASDPERFVIAGGDVVIPAVLGTLTPRTDDHATELSGGVRSSLAEFETDPGAASRLESLLPALDARARGMVQLALAWRAQRAHAADAAARLVELERSVLDPDSMPFVRVAAGLALLRATRHEPVPELSILRAAQGETATAIAVVERLRELGAHAEAELLETTARDLAARRHVLSTARRLLGVLSGSRQSLALAVADRALLFRPSSRDGEGEGALVDAVELVARLRAAPGLLVVPWSGTLLLRTSSSPSARAGDAEPIDVVPGLCAIEPETPDRGQTGPIGLLLVFCACAAVFVAALFGARRALARERDAMRLRSEFLTSVTHELRTPVAAIRLLAERLAANQVKDDARRAEYHTMLAGEATRLGALVENVLDLGRIERGERSHDLREVGVREVVGEIAQVFGTLARASGVAFEVEDASDDACVRADRGALLQALFNLCDNARKYGGTAGSITLTAHVHGDQVELAVRDRGPGVPAADRARIFGRFVRGTEHQHGLVPGVGLGLHLARSIAEAHGGTLELETPEDGPGARFVLRLPRALRPNDRESMP